VILSNCCVGVLSLMRAAGCHRRHLLLLAHSRAPALTILYVLRLWLALLQLLHVMWLIAAGLLLLLCVQGLCCFWYQAR